LSPQTPTNIDRNSSSIQNNQNFSPLKDNTNSFIYNLSYDDNVDDDDYYEKLDSNNSNDGVNPEDRAFSKFLY